MDTSEISSMVPRAFERAAILHRNQIRKGSGYPFIIHPIRVYFILVHFTDDEHTLVAGILHDNQEDIPQETYSKEDLKREFGEIVSRTVEGASEKKDPKDSRETKIASWGKRKRDHLKKLENEDERTLMVVCADKIDNLRDLIEGYQREGEKHWERFNAPGKKIMWYFRANFTLLQAKLDNPIVAQLGRFLREAEELVGNKQ